MLSRLTYSTFHNFNSTILLKSILVRRNLPNIKNFSNPKKGKILKSFKLTLFGGSSVGFLSKNLVKVQCEAKALNVQIAEVRNESNFDWKLFW